MNEKEKSIASAIGTLITRTFGPSSDLIGQELADRISRWRTNNLEKIAQKVAQKEEPLLLTDEVEPSDGFKLLTFEAASSEENDEVQELWAELILAAKRGDVGKEYRPLVEILKEFTPLMALCLAVRINQKMDRFGPSLKGSILPAFENDSLRLAQYSDEDILVAIDHLMRLNLVTSIRRRLELNLTRGGKSSDVASAAALEEVVGYIQRAINQPSLPASESVRRVKNDGKELVILMVDTTALGQHFAKLLRIGLEK